jgi:tetratricopeptide (TPR) repeat protein
MSKLEPKELVEKGVLYIRLVQLEMGIPVLQQAYQEAIAQGDLQTALDAIAYLLRCYAEKDDFDTLFKIKSEIQEFGLLEKITLNSQFYYTLGICSFYQNQFGEARKYFNLARERAQSESVPRKVQAEVGLAIVEIEEGRWSEAKIRLEMAKSLLEHMNEPALPTMMMIVLLNEGRLSRLMGAYKEALCDYWRALEINKYHKSLFGYYYLLYEMSITYYSIGKYDYAKMYLELLRSSMPEKEVVRLEKLASELHAKLSKITDYDLLIDRKKRKIIEKTRGEINFGSQDLILDLFILLTQNQGKIYSKEELSDIIWNETYNPMVHDNKIYVTIKRLRTLIEPDIQYPQYILRSRNGYFLNQSLKIAVSS